jgi:putative transposase
MARLKRLVLPGSVHHVIQRAAEGSRAFGSDVDCELFLLALRRSSVEHRVSVHAYVLVDDHFQLLATPSDTEDLSRMMQALSRFYVASFNHRHGRAGALWQSRFRAAPVGGPAELLSCMLFVEQTPRRAGVSGAMVDFTWSSAALHAGKRNDPIWAAVPPGSAYWLLGNTPFEREATYAALLELPLATDQLERIEATTLKGWAMGSGEFIASLASGATRRAVAGARGRPRKTI